ncbi:MAG TPA: spore protease YyaC [Thermaerobacter sp.]
MRDGIESALGGGSPPRARAELRVRADEPGAAQRLAEQVARCLGRLGRPRVVILCIGTDRSTGDALGPLVGTMLTRGEVLQSPQAWVVGTLNEPVHAGNLEHVLAGLCGSQPSTAVVAVDACLGRSENVGSISVGTGPLQPGAGVNKALPPVGDVFVTGTVNVGGFMEYFVLQNTRLSLVMRMAEVIAAGLAAGVSAFLTAREAAAGRGGAG